MSKALSPHVPQEAMGQGAAEGHGGQPILRGCAGHRRVFFLVAVVCL